MIREYNYDLVLHPISECYSLVNANKLERYWICKLKEQGFILCNLTDGGDGTPGHKSNFTEEWRKNLSIAARKRQLSNPSFKDKKHSAKSKALMSDNHADTSGRRNPFFNRKHSEEFKQQLRKDRTGKGLKKYKITSPDGEVYFVTEGLNSFCYRSDIQEYNLCPSGFSNVLTGRYKTHKGWTAKYIS